MRSSRIIYIISEIVNLLMLLLIIVLFFYSINSYVKKRFVSNRNYEIEKNATMLESFLEEKKNIFKNFRDIRDKEHAAPLLHGFADIYTLDSKLRITRIIRKEPGSAIFTGYDFSYSKVADFLRNSIYENSMHSKMVRSPEKDDVSIYIAIKSGNEILAGRVPLDTLTLDFAIFAGYRNDIILFASAEGFVISSSKKDLNLHLLPAGTDDTIKLEDKYFITRMFSPSLGGMLVMLTPVSTVTGFIDNTRRYLAYLMVIFLFLMIIRIVIFFSTIIHPLEKFITTLSQWGVEERLSARQKFLFRIREIHILYTTFYSKTEQVRQSISMLRESEKELKEMRHYLKSIIDSMPSIIISVDMNARVNEWNRAAEVFTGIPAEKAVNNPIWHMIPELGRYSDAFYEVLSLKELREFKKQVIQRREKIYMDITIFPITGLESTAAAIKLDDITQMEKTEQSLRQAQKMEVIGTLSGGLAHDFNNVLGGILGAVSIIQKKICTGTEISSSIDGIVKYLNIIEQSSGRASGIISRLLSLSRKQEIEFSAVDLNVIVSNAENICRNSLDKSIEITSVLAQAPAAVNADPNQLEQVLLNMCINAAHAMTIMKPPLQQYGGRLTITVGETIPGEILAVRFPEASAGTGYRFFSVEDNGVGIDSSRLDKIFDPFYTTKFSGSGSGLGLSMAYNIIKLHGGFITVSSQVEEGSTFTVYLPSITMPPAEEKPVQVAEIKHGSGTILVVDDEPVINGLAQDILKDCGYNVLSAYNGIEAIAVLNDNCGLIDMVLLDLMMPGMSGMEVFSEMKKIQPSLKILMSSGFGQDDRISSIIAMGADGFIRKPYNMTELSGAVYRVLEPNKIQ